MTQEEAELKGKIAGLEEAAELCRLYRGVWSNSSVASREHHITAAQNLKNAIDQRARALREGGFQAMKKTRRYADQFTLGWLGAASVVANKGEDTLAMELMRACGIETLAALDDTFGLEQYDRDSLAAAIARSA